MEIDPAKKMCPSWRGCQSIEIQTEIIDLRITNISKLKTTMLKIIAASTLAVASLAAPAIEVNMIKGYHVPEALFES